MINKHFTSIKELRQSKNLSQLDIAQKIGISRSSYIGFEKGKIELSLSAATKLADLLGISLLDVEGGLKPNYEKYKEMILAFLKIAETSDKKIVKTKLAKLLYLADFAWFYEHLTSMSGMQYRRIQFGPVPDIYFRAIDELEEEGKINVERKDEMILININKTSLNQPATNLSADEIDLINKISSNWKNRKTNEIVDFTHRQLPYQICAPDEIIPYELITQEDPDNVY